MRTLFGLGCTGLLFLSGCEEPPNALDVAVSRIETAIGVAAPVGRTVSAALSVDAGLTANLEGTTCSQLISSTCDSGWPCEAQLEVRVDEHCPFPLAGDLRGTVTVDVRFEGPGSGTIVAGFADLQRTDGLLLVEAEAVHATWVPGGAIGEYASAHVHVAESRPRLIEGAAWSVTVIDGGTPDDPRDDSYLIVGGEGQLDDAVIAISVDGVVVDQSCTANPVAGSAHATVLIDDEAASLALDFHAECDGLADIVAGHGLDVEAGALIDVDFGP